MLPVLLDAVSWDHTTPYAPYGSLLKFLKTNYAGVDSITLLTNAYSQSQGGSAVVQLYNKTDNVSIAGTKVISTNYSSSYNSFDMWTESKNLYSLLPNKEVTLAIDLTPAVDGQLAIVSKTYLVLYRK